MDHNMSTRITKRLRHSVLWFLCIFAAVLLLSEAGFSEEYPVFPGTPAPWGTYQENRIIGASSTDPVLYSSTKQTTVNTDFFLSWDAGDASICILYVSFNGGEFESLGNVDPVTSAYVQNKAEPGKYSP